MVPATEFLFLLAAQLGAGLLVWALARVATPGGLLQDARARRWSRGLFAADLGLPALWFVCARGWNPHLGDGLIPWLILLFVGQATAALLLALIALLRAGRKPRRGAPDVLLTADRLRRRVLLRTMAVALPTLAVATGSAGAVEAARTARLRRRTVVLAGLPPALDGLRILHLSDTHLWRFVTLSDLDEALAPLAGERVDLVCHTGDVADDLDQLAPALARIAQLAPPLGCFACLGNHEYARGLPRVLDAFAQSRVQLLRGSAQRIRHDGAAFTLVGIDDPRGAPGVVREDFYRAQVEAVMRPLPPGTFVVALSHRPGAFPAAADAGIALTLAGHTHGGQAAVMGTSLLSIATPEPYAWGVYERDGKSLHVTCGAGHWFPVRLGCPPEIVLLELRRR